MTAQKLPRNDDGTLPAYAWPGGYQMYYVDGWNAVLCPDCANRIDREWEASTDDMVNDDERDKPVACDVHWEGDPLICDHCGEQIESAYGMPDDEPNAPEEGDYVLQDSGALGSKTVVSIHGGESLGSIEGTLAQTSLEFPTEDDARQFLRTRMEQEQHWPNVWKLSDHGNWILTTLD